MWRDTTPTLLFGKLERSSKFVEGIAAQHCADKGRVGVEDMVDLSQGTREIVDPVHAERAHDEIEALWLVWKRLLVIYDMACDIDLLVERFISIAEQQLLR